MPAHASHAFCSHAAQVLGPNLHEAATNAPNRHVALALALLQSRLATSFGESRPISHALAAFSAPYATIARLCPDQFPSAPPLNSASSVALGLAQATLATSGSPVTAANVTTTLADLGQEQPRVSVMRALGTIPGEPRTMEVAIRRATGTARRCVMFSSTPDQDATLVTCP